MDGSPEIFEDISLVFRQYPRLLDPDYIDAYDFADCWTFKYPSASFEDQDVAAALIKCNGNYSQMAKVLGRSRRSVEQYVLKNPALRELWDDIRQTYLDAVEDKVKTDGLVDPQGARFIMQTIGKDRGYSSRQEQTGKDGGPLQFEQVNRDAEEFAQKMVLLSEQTKLIEK